MAGFGEFPAAIAARYDIITFDPRGFGYSTAIRCFPTMAAENKFLGRPARVPRRREAGRGLGTDLGPVRRAVRPAQRQPAGPRHHRRCGQGHEPAARGRRRPGAELHRRVLRHRARRHLRQPVPRHDRAHDPGREPQPGRLDPPGRRAADLAAPGLGPGVRGDDAGLPGPVRQGNDRGVRVLRGHPGRDPRQVGHAAAPAPPASGHHRPAAGLHLRRRGRLRAAGHGEPVADRRQPAAATVGGLVRPRPAGRPVRPPAPAAPPAAAAASRLHRARSRRSPCSARTARTRATRPPTRQPARPPTPGRAASGCSGLDSEACADWPAAAAQDRYAGPWNRPTASTILVLRQHR